jgi:hypothetical protein
MGGSTPTFPCRNPALLMVNAYI